MKAKRFGRGKHEGAFRKLPCLSWNYVIQFEIILIGICARR
jgi:hypothetical protein